MGAGRTGTLTDGWIDRHEETNSRFRNFAKSPKNKKNVTHKLFIYLQKIYDSVRRKVYNIPTEVGITMKLGR
jgi:hypothetical protein